jgi:hypothetical protein
MSDKCASHSYSTEDVLKDALNYILHVGSNWTERGEPHPQEWLVKRLQECIKSSHRPDGGLRYLGTFLGFKVYEDPSLKEGEFRLNHDAQITNEMLELEKRLFATTGSNK